MADQVNRLMEAMIPELEDYRRRNLFTPQEINAIVTQRRTHEYKLARRIPQQSDYLTYITYELNLNQLRKKRKTKLKTTTITTTATASSHTSLSDHAGLSRICFLFERCLRHFHSSPQLWLHYLHFLTASQSTRRLSLTLPRAHLLLPHSAQLWLAHAQHCFTTTADMSALRSLMQRAVRLMRGRDGEESVWLGWFGYEVGFIAKVMERKRVLGINVRDTKRGDFDVRYKAGGGGSGGEGEGGGEVNAAEGETASSSREEEKKKGLDELVLTAVLPTLIYTNATATPATTTASDRQYLVSRKKRKRGVQPPPPHSHTRQLASSLPFRLSFLSLIPHSSNERFDSRALPSAEVRRLVRAMTVNERSVYVRRVEWSGLLRQVYDGLERDFAGSVDVLPLLADWKRRQAAAAAEVEGEEGGKAGSEESERTGWAVYEAAVERGLSGVWTAYLHYLQQRLTVRGLSERAVLALSQQVEAVTQQLMAMVELPAEDGLALLLSELLVRVGNKQQAVTVLQSATNRQQHQIVVTWQQLAGLADTAEARAAVWQEAVAALPEDERHIALLDQLNELVWLHSTGEDGNDSSQQQQQAVLDHFQAAFHLSSHTSLVTALLDYLSSTPSLQSNSSSISSSTRSLLLSLPLTAHSSLAVLAWCEQWGVVDAVLVRRLWEGVVSDRSMSGDVGVWRRWMAWEMERGEVAAANRLRWRAEKVLGSGVDL